MAEPLYNQPGFDNESESGDSASLDQAEHAREVAQYLGDMVGQLESMARLAGLDLLVYLLSMARVEAETHARFVGEARRSSFF